MDIQPLTGILNGIGSSGEWDQQRQLRQLIAQWPALVGSAVAEHSCPLEVRQGTLQVATSTAIWAQNLSFERRRILEKLNQRSQFQVLHLKEIRFSTAQWHNRPGSSGAIAVDTRLDSYRQQLQWQQHPSRLPPAPNQATQPATPTEPAPSAAQAFTRWRDRRQQQVNQIPACPTCGVPSPVGELQRWGQCAFCMTRRWQAEKQATQPDGKTEAESWKSEAKAIESSVQQAPAAQASQSSLNRSTAADSWSQLASSRQLAQKLSLRGSLAETFPQPSSSPTPPPAPHRSTGSGSLSSGRDSPVRKRPTR